MVNKQIGLKQAEMSINRFNEMAIPHHLGLLNNHRSNIEKSLALGDWQKIKKEEINALRVIKQIKNLMLEMDALREQVQESDQAQFDVLVNIGKEKAFAGMKQYMGEYINKLTKLFLIIGKCSYFFNRDGCLRLSCKKCKQI